MLGELIKSRSRSKILELFLSNSELEIHLREISRRIAENYNSTRRELNYLEELSLLISRKDGNQRYFKINKDHLIYPDLKNIFLKTSGMGNVIKNSLDKVRALRQLIQQKNLQTLIEIDGGVNEETIADIAAAGVDVFVAGSAIFGSRNYQATINAFREKIGG